MENARARCQILARYFPLNLIYPFTFVPVTQFVDSTYYFNLQSEMSILTILLQLDALILPGLKITVKSIFIFSF